MQPPTPHDALVKAIFARPEHAAGELRHLLPAALAARIDWNTLRLRRGSFVDDALRDRHTDLLFSVSCDGADLLLYLLFEHQSTDDPLMAFRLLLYMVRVWEQRVREHPRATRLPAIVPIVLHHSKRGWTSPTAFEDLLAVDAETLPLLAEYVPRFRFLLDDISVESDDALRSRAMSALGRLALFCLRHAREPRRMLKELARWLDLVHEVHAAPGGREALVLIWRYILTTSEEKPERLVKRLVAVVGENGKEAIMTAGEQLIERGRKEGLRKGSEQMLRKVLVKQLEARFGVLPDAATARIKKADGDQLELWFDRGLTAATLDEVLGAT